MKPSRSNLDDDEVKAAKDYLLGRTRAPESRGGPSGRSERAPSPSSPFPAPPPPAFPEPAPASGPALELSATDIRRTESGWRARCIHKRGVDSRHVNDARYGGYLKSFIEAVEVRDRFCRERGVPIPWEIEAVVDGVRVAPEVVRMGEKVVVRWRDEEHEVTGADAEEIATEIALDLFIEYLDGLHLQAADGEDGKAGESSQPL